MKTKIQKKIILSIFILVGILLSFIAVYYAFGFVSGESNTEKWSGFMRFMYVIVSLFVSWLVSIIAEVTVDI